MDQKSSLKWLWVSLAIIGIIIFGFISVVLLLFLNLGSGTEIEEIFIILIPIVIVALLVWGLISLFSKKSEIINKKTYKSEEIKSHMKIQYLFYVVGVIFVFISIWYFARSYIKDFPNIIKLVLLVVSIVVSFVVAEFLRGADK